MDIEKPTFKQIVLLNIQQLTNFPYIEKDFDALTDYGLLCKVVDKMNEVITNNNIQNESINTLYDAFLALKNFVDNYFENLDVQDEINIKLEDMAVSGELTNLISSYIDPIQENFENEVNDNIDYRINQVERLVNNAVTGTPIAVTSTSDMTDRNKLYLNLTDGYVYYYSSGWQQAFLYQAIENSDNSIKYTMLDTNLQDGIIPFEITTSSYSNENKIYTGSVGDTIELEDSSNSESGVITVSEGDTIICPYISRGGTAYNALIFTDSDDEIISVVPKTTIMTAVLTNGSVFKIRVPRNATKLYFNNSTARNEVFYPYRITKFTYFDKRINNIFSLKEKLSINNTLTNTIYSTYSFNLSISNYKTVIYNVTPFDKIRIETTIPGDQQFVAAIFFDSNLKPVSLYPEFGTNQDRAIQFDCIVPANATKLYLCTKSSYTTNVYKYKLTDKYKLNVDYIDGELTITNLFNSNYIKFSHFGGNNLFMIEEYKIGSNTITTHTDMIPAPYIVKAINNPLGDDQDNKYFTGGNHQYNNQSSGSTATARETSLNIYCDGLSLSNNTSKECNEITIVEVNRVQGYNTRKSDGSGREILEEKIVFKFDGKTLDVINTITPLEEILIERYYGIQTALFNNNLYKIYSDKIYNYDTQGYVLKKPDMIIGNNIICSKMFSEGLGDYRYNLATQKVNISNQKSYYCPVYNNTTNFTTSDINYIHGQYILDINQT